MKKKERKPLVSDLILLAIVAVAVLVGFALFKLTNFLLITPIDMDDVSSVRFYKYQFDEEETEKFVSLFNGSQYRGKGEDVREVAGYRVNIYMSDGTQMEVHKFADSFIVTPNSEEYDDYYYVKNDALYDFMDQCYMEYIQE